MGRVDFSFSLSAPHGAEAKLAMCLHALALWGRRVSAHSLRCCPSVFLAVFVGLCSDLLLILGFRFCPFCVGNADLMAPADLSCLIISGPQGITSLSSQICHRLKKCFYLLPSAFRNPLKI